MRNTAILSNHQKQCTQNASTRESTESLARCHTHQYGERQKKTTQQLALHRLNAATFLRLQIIDLI